MDTAAHRLETQLPGPVRVLLVDEHEQELWGLWKLVEGEWPRMMVAGTARTLDVAAKLSGTDLVDVIVIDMLPALRTGFNRFLDLRRQAGTAIVVLADACNPDLDRRILEAGASAVVRKHEPAGVLLDQIERAARVRNAPAMRPSTQELPEEPVGFSRARPT